MDKNSDLIDPREILSLLSRWRVNHQQEWSRRYQHRYVRDSTYASHEDVASVAYASMAAGELPMDNDNLITAPEQVAFRNWFALGLPTWWATEDVLALIAAIIEHSSPEDNIFSAVELPDLAGCVMFPRNTIKHFDQTEQEEIEITSVIFSLFKSMPVLGAEPEDALVLAFTTERGVTYNGVQTFGNPISTNCDVASRGMAQLLILAARLLQIIYDARGSIKSSTQLSPAKMKHGVVRPALLSRRVVGEEFKYIPRAPLGGSHRPPLPHRRKAHIQNVWVGRGEQRRLEPRHFPACWVMDSRLTQEERAQLINLFGAAIVRESAVPA